MTTAQNSLAFQKPLRVWPGVALGILHLIFRFVIPRMNADWGFIGLMGSLVCTLGIVLWFLFFSRATWLERIGGLLMSVVGVLLAKQIIDRSIATGAMGMLFYFLVVPAIGLALVLWAVISRPLTIPARRIFLVFMIFLACGFWALIRTGGFSGEFKQDFAWRWSKTPEEKLLEKQEEIPAAPAVVPEQAKTPEQPGAPASSTTEPAKTAEQPAIPDAVPPPVDVKAEWPGFRGPERNDTIHGVRINTDWSASPPVELWRREIGPGWSSFAVQGNLVFTQEQRGDHELVTCYNKNTGKPIWMHKDSTRFWESNAGAGPRGTPTLHNGRLYSLGATGILNALNASDGRVVWSRNAAKDSKTKTPGWGFASSPLVVDDLVIVATSGQLVGYDIASGTPRWFGPKGGTDYSSPHLVTIREVPQVVMLNATGAISVDPATGKLLWEYKMPVNARIVQPSMTPDGDLLVSQGEGHDLRRISVAKDGSGWNVKERWTSNGLKPYFSDYVVHKGYAYGFDGSFLSCIDLKDGQRKWKGGHYGSGQLMLLADQDVLLVLTESGELALVEAVSDQFKELGRASAIEGKTWNHPVLVENVLLVRNGEEMAAFRLARAVN